MKLVKIIAIIVVILSIGFFAKRAFAPNSLNDSYTNPEGVFDEFGMYEFQAGNVAISAKVPFDDSGKLVHESADYVANYIKTFAENVLANPSDSPFPMNLTFDFKVYESDAIVSYVIQGYEFTGGAHGNTFVKSFNYEKSSGRQLNVLDLVTSQDHLWTFAALLDKSAVVEYPEGASGDNPDNWNVWYADNESVTFIFQTYQIASYSAGQQEFRMVAIGDNASMFDQKYFK